MATKSSFKKHISWSITGIVILALAITIIIQNRRINALIRESSNSSPQQDISNCNAEIDKLRSQIADMQAWQDYLEDALNENNEDQIPAPQTMPAGNRFMDNSRNIINNPALRNGMRSSISLRYDALAEEIGLSEETKSKLLDLLGEMRLEIMNRLPGRGGLPPEMIDRAALIQQMEDINSSYNKKISELLSEDEFYAFKEYQNSERERILIMGLNRNIFEDDNILDSEKEKELVNAMYNARQADPDTKSENDSLTLFGRSFGPPQINGGIENAEKLNSIYLESARGILTEDQMEKFKDFLNAGQSAFIMRRAPRPDMLRGAEQRDPGD